MLLIWFIYTCADDDICRYDNLTIYNRVEKFDRQSAHLIGTYCGVKVPQKMMFIHSAMMIFKTDYSIPSKGFEILYALQGKYC